MARRAPQAIAETAFHETVPGAKRSAGAFIQRLLSAFLALALALVGASGAAEPNAADGGAGDERVLSAIGWIIERIHEGTHLLRSYDNPADSSSYTYDQAVGVIGLLETGHRHEASVVIEGMLSLLAKSREEPGMTAFADAYRWDTGDEVPGARTRAVGPNAWMGLAFLWAYGRLQDPRYLRAARDIATWLIENLRVGQGELAPALRGGVEPDSKAPLQWISTEHNADMLALLRGLEAIGAAPLQTGGAWGDYANELEKWMVKRWEEGGLWDEAQSHFVIGYEAIDPPRVSTFNEVLDSQTWTLLALEASSEVTGRQTWKNHVGLDWLDARWRVSVECGGVQRVGFSKRTFARNETDVPIVSYWVEGMAGYALARLLAPPAGSINPLTWHKVIDDLLCFQGTNGGLPYTVGEKIDLSASFDGDPPPNEFPIATFSSFNNIFGGEPGVHGDAQPDWKNRSRHAVSWFCPVPEPGKCPVGEKYVPSPRHSFCLVNDSNRLDRYGYHSEGRGWNEDDTKWNPWHWASFSLTLNPRKGLYEPPCSRDISSFSELRFWARAKAPGIRVKVSIADRSGEHFWPEIGGKIVNHECWEQIRVLLADIRGVDLKHARSVGINFGSMVGEKSLNNDQAALWVDDFSFYPSKEPLRELQVEPENWTWKSVASTGWFIFANRRVNPFEVRPPAQRESSQDGTP